MSVQANIKPLGECALIVTLGSSIAPDIHKAVLQLSKSLERAPFPGFVEAVPAYASVTVYYDPIAVYRAAGRAGDNAHGVNRPQEQVRSWLESRVRSLNASPNPNGSTVTPSPKEVRIRVCYCEQCGPDLRDVATYHRLSVDEVVRIHTAASYTVYMIGFLPGFPYLGGMSEKIATPRLNTPRASVPAGSVGIAGSQTGVYPLASPGGWRLIGRTGIPLFRPERRPPSLLSAGDAVRFVPAAHSEFEAGVSS
ncbi:5-oxoprolinase subunit PxpB [Paenibacillus thermotolerans]|uniref:5-oxoprolinase subunit PxpB n=1 Tax=Paenibacillus thermotolerans TaxID=3027807 RepID=UPI002367B9DA|nr:MULTISPECIES: 5-oxoprolinase subunit PxpB [unclassified Paenibacillus]